MNTTPEMFAELVAQIARRFPRNDDAEALKGALRSSEHPFWSDLVKHFGQKIKSVLRSIGKVVAVPATEAKPTADCFTNQTRYYYRDADLDKFLPTNQSAQDASQFEIYELTGIATFKQVAESILTFSKTPKGTQLHLTSCH